jgi:putative ABC transport system ATP-binding protein
MTYAGIPKEERLKKAEALLKEVGLGDRMNHTSNQLSGGQMQRVAIARALSMNPAIILADEPTGNISTVQAKEVMDIFQGLQKQGHTIVIITHEPSIAAYAQRTIHIKDGKIEKETKNRKA